MSELYLENEFYDVSHEATEARTKFGEQLDIGNLAWLAILAEEFGEAAMLVTQCEVPPVEGDARHRLSELYHLREELWQTAAVAMRWSRALSKEIRETDKALNAVGDGQDRPTELPDKSGDGLQ